MGKGFDLIWLGTTLFTKGPDAVLEKPEEIPVVLTDDVGDQCCSLIMEKWSELYSSIIGDAHYGIEENGISCDNLRRELEQFADTDYGYYLYGGPGQHPDPTVPDRLKAAAAEMLEEWDACSAESFSGDFTASEDAFEGGWDALTKMPFVNDDGVLSARTLYQGRRTGDKDSHHWTPHKDKALAYAMFGPRYDYDATPFVDANEHFPELWMVEAPEEEDPHDFVRRLRERGM